ncbi:hypothetical protein [uncultured Parabacteroides sp.]|nr:hypothetical protein [uncultured Parabacteroides sp.]
METLELEILTTKEFVFLMGGIWVFNPEIEEWYWIEPRGLDDPFVIRDIN